MKIAEISLNDPAISGKIRLVNYEVTYFNAVSPEEARQRVAAFESAESVEIVKVHKGRHKSRDLKECVSSVEVSDGTLKMTINGGPSGSIHPVDAAAGLLGLTREEARSLKILKTAVSFES